MVQIHDRSSQNNTAHRQSNTSINIVNEPISQNRRSSNNQIVDIYSNNPNIQNVPPQINDTRHNRGGGNISHAEIIHEHNIPQGNTLYLQNIPQNGHSQANIIRNAQGFQSPILRENVLYQEQRIHREQSGVENINQNQTFNGQFRSTIDSNVQRQNANHNSRSENCTPNNANHSSNGHYNSNHNHGFQNNFQNHSGNPYEDMLYQSMSNCFRRMNEQNTFNRSSNYNNGKWNSQQYKIVIENCQFWGDGPECDSKLGH